METTKKWHVRRKADGKTYGAYKEEELRTYLAQGRISPNDLARNDGNTVRVGDLLGLKEDEVAPPPPVAWPRIDWGRVASLIADHFPEVNTGRIYVLAACVLLIPLVSLLCAALSNPLWANFWILAVGGPPWLVGGVLSVYYYCREDGYRRPGFAGLMAMYVLFMLTALYVFRRFDLIVASLGNVANLLSMF